MVIKKGKINYHNHSLKESEKDLIQQMLTVDPKKRITIEGIKKHPWFVENIPKGYQFPKVEKKILKNIQKPIPYSNINKPSLQQLESIQKTNMESLLIDLRKEGSNETKILYQIINKTKKHLETENSRLPNNGKQSNKKNNNTKQKKKKRSSSFQRIGKTNTRKKSLKDFSKIQPLKSNFYFEEKTKITQLDILIKKTNKENKITMNELFEIALKLDIFDINFNKRNKKDKNKDKCVSKNNRENNTAKNTLEIIKKKKKRTNSITSKFKLFTKTLNNTTKQNENSPSKNTQQNNKKSENNPINSEKSRKNEDDTDNSYNSITSTTNKTNIPNTTDTKKENNNNNRNNQPTHLGNSNNIIKDIQTIFKKLNFNKINFDYKKKVIIEQLMDNNLYQNISNSNTSKLLIQFIETRLYRFGSTKKQLEKYLVNYQLNSENLLKDKSEFCSLNNKTQKKINQKLKTHLKNMKKQLFKRIGNSHNIPTYQFPDRLIGISSSNNIFEVITQLQSALTINGFDWKHQKPRELKLNNQQINLKMKIQIQILPFEKIVNKICNNYLSERDDNFNNNDNTSNKKLLKKKKKIHTKTINQILKFNTENEKRKWNVFISIKNYSNNKKNISKHAKNIIKFVNH
ncbi:ovarian-specific serine/threonine-protein kinase lok-related [Anaeramoeba flamelloides]|uniref:Ovarian-specific serine/threonine-protein kinase lok-related n=1 Tax=Anaeramoeba flamelloides TaxID=1746091 RepID=A0AAV7YU70_9EUKA|nr:ovarian-specific serine/threonine-protein kinase lok-related [Anaeramoeba flamelloides]